MRDQFFWQFVLLENLKCLPKQSQPGRVEIGICPRVVDLVVLVFLTVHRLQRRNVTLVVTATSATFFASQLSAAFFPLCDEQ